MDEQGVDIAGELALWDLGTEANEEPGVGPNQAPRQEGAGEGEVTTDLVKAVNGVDVDGWLYPEVDSFLTVELAWTFAQE